jgi:hypothetical protein
VAKRPNYSFNKHQKEIKRQRKKEEKAAKRLRKKELATQDSPVDVEGISNDSASRADFGAAADHQRRNE